MREQTGTQQKKPLRSVYCNDVRPSFVLAHPITMFRIKWWNNNHIQAQHTMVGEKIVYSIEEGAELWRELSSKEMSCQVECHSTQEQPHE